MEERAIPLLKRQDTIRVERSYAFFLHEIRTTPLKWLIPQLLLTIFPYGLLLSPYPELLTDFFASQASGLPFRQNQCLFCTGCDVSDACKQAQTQAASINLYADAGGNMIGAFANPVLGVLSDSYGRKPVMIGFAAMSVGANVFLVVSVLSLVHRWTNGISLWWYIVTRALVNPANTLSVSFAYAADCVSPQNRASSFALTLAIFSLAIMFGPIVGARVTLPENCWLILGLSLGAGAWTLVLPETVSPQSSRPPLPLSSLINPLHGMGILNRSRLFRSLGVCAFGIGVTGEGTQNLMLFYYQKVFDMGAKERSGLFLAIGITMLLLQLVLMHKLVSLFGERRLLIAGLLANFLHLFGYAGLGQLYWMRWISRALAIGLLYLNVTLLTSLSMLAFPAIGAIKANSVGDHEQGQVQGALQGCKSLASVIGPLFFGYLWGSVPQVPSLCFAVAGGLGVIIFVVALGLPRKISRPLPTNAAPCADLDWDTSLQHEESPQAPHRPADLARFPPDK